MTAPLVLLAVLAVISGFVVFEGVGEALGFHSGFLGFVYNISHGPEEFHINWGISILSVALVGVGLGAGWFFWSGAARPAKVAGEFSPFGYRLLLNRFYIDEAYQFVIDKIILASGNAISWFDRAIVNDSGVQGAGELTDFAGDVAKRAQTGRLPNYALAIVVGVVVIAAVAFGYRT
jgi:NADH-quinone oxidoreductase subunit L